MTEEKELKKIIDALTRNYKLIDIYKKGQTIKYRAKYLDTTLHAQIIIPDDAVGITISYPRSHLPSGIRITWLEPEK